MPQGIWPKRIRKDMNLLNPKPVAPSGGTDKQRVDRCESDLRTLVRPGALWNNVANDSPRLFRLRGLFPGMPSVIRLN